MLIHFCKDLVRGKINGWNTRNNKNSETVHCQMHKGNKELKPVIFPLVPLN